jgi:hypothetical protein
MRLSRHRSPSAQKHQPRCVEEQVERNANGAGRIRVRAGARRQQSQPINNSGQRNRAGRRNQQDMTSVSGDRKGYRSAKGEDVTRALGIETIERTDGAVEGRNSHVKLLVC